MGRPPKNIPVQQVYKPAAGSELIPLGSRFVSKKRPKPSLTPLEAKYHTSTLQAKKRKENITPASIGGGLGGGGAVPKSKKITPIASWGDAGSRSSSADPQSLSYLSDSSYSGDNTLSFGPMTNSNKMQNFEPLSQSTPYQGNPDSARNPTSRPLSEIETTASQSSTNPSTSAATTSSTSMTASAPLSEDSFLNPNYGPTELFMEGCCDLSASSSNDSEDEMEKQTVEPPADNEVPEPIENLEPEPCATVQPEPEVSHVDLNKEGKKERKRRTKAEIAEDTELNVNQLQTFFHQFCLSSAVPVHRTQLRKEAAPKPKSNWYQSFIGQKGSAVEMDNVQMLACAVPNTPHGVPIEFVREVIIPKMLSPSAVAGAKKLLVSNSLLPDNKVNFGLSFEANQSTLSDILESPRCAQFLNEKNIRRITRLMLRSLMEIHEMGYLHGSLRPQNLVIGANGEVKLKDFSHSSTYENCMSYYINAGCSNTRPSVNYLAPEIIMKQNSDCRKVDCWAVACILAEMYLKRPLFEGTNQMSQLKQIHSLLGPIQNASFTSSSCLQASASGTPEVPKNSSVFKAATGMVIKNALCMDLLLKLFEYDTTKRLSAAEALMHPYFQEN